MVEVLRVSFGGVQPKRVFNFLKKSHLYSKICTVLVVKEQNMSVKNNTKLNVDENSI